MNYCLQQLNVTTNHVHLLKLDTIRYAIYAVIDCNLHNFFTYSSFICVISVTRTQQ